MNARHSLPSGTSAGAIVLWLLGYAVRRWQGLVAAIGTMVAGIGLDLLAPWPMKVIVDHVLMGHEMAPALRSLAAAVPGAGTAKGLLGWSVAATIVLFVLRWGLGLTRAYVNIGFGRRMVYDLAGDLFIHLQRLSLRFHSRKSIGDTIRRVTVDSGCVATIVSDAVVPLLSALLSLAAMFFVMWRLDPTLTLLSLAVVPMMLAGLARYWRPMLDVSYQQQEVEGRIYSVVDETLTAMPAVQAYGAEPRADARFRATTADIVDASLAAVTVQLEFKIAIASATALGTAAILWVGAGHVIDGSLSVGSVLVFLSYLASLYGPLESLMHAPSTTQAAAGSARRVLEVLQAEREVSDKPGATALPPVRGDVRLEQVSVGYVSSRPVLHGISIEARAGETIALVGPTGAGTSTLVGLLPRFIDPWEGRVLVDGHDVRDVTLESLRGQIAIVLQEPFLFPMTIAENIAYGRPGADQLQIEAAARAANAHDFISRLPDGYQTMVGERGATLSGGERQRLSIARALLKDAPILILDEPTSAVDAETESLLLEALERLVHGRTTFIIAHRLSTIRRADRVFVVQAGTIVETGTHRELIAEDGVYTRLHRLQELPVAAEAGR
ncbi:MAG: ABC transporter ATP-binding protein [Acidobacteria bacterium]|nr:ABC transporter ATP-binding protein [Acidobacteriota bacterium]